MPWSSVAVCVSGQARTSTCRFADARAHPAHLTAIASIRQNLIEPLSSLAETVDVFTALSSPPRKNQRLPGAGISQLSTVLNTLRPVQGALIDEADDEAAYKAISRRPLAAGPSGGVEANASACVRLGVHLATLFTPGAHAQARKLQACWQMIVARERQRGAPYDLVLRVRPDLVFPRPIDLTNYGMLPAPSPPTSHTPGVHHHEDPSPKRSNLTAMERGAWQASTNSSEAIGHGWEAIRAVSLVAASKEAQTTSSASPTARLQLRQRLEPNPEKPPHAPPSTAREMCVHRLRDSPTTPVEASTRRSAGSPNLNATWPGAGGFCYRPCDGKSPESLGLWVGATRATVTPRVPRVSSSRAQYESRGYGSSGDEETSSIEEDESLSTADYLMSPPFPSMVPALYLHDHFYVARRRVAAPLFNHLSLVENTLIIPTRDHLTRWSKGVERNGAVRLSRSRLNYCEATLASLSGSSLPTPCPTLARYIERAGHAPWRCAQARQHECALAMGLATHPSTCCSERRVRFLRDRDVPHLLRIKDAASDAVCDLAAEVFACAERPGIRPNKCGGAGGT